MTYDTLLFYYKAGGFINRQYLSIVMFSVRTFDKF